MDRAFCTADMLSVPLNFLPLFVASIFILTLPFSFWSCSQSLIYRVTTYVLQSCTYCTYYTLIYNHHLFSLFKKGDIYIYILTVKNELFEKAVY